MRSFAVLRGAGFSALAIAAVLTASCSSSTVSGGAPIPQPSINPVPASSSVTTSTSSSVTLPTVGTSSVTVGGSLPSATVATSLTESVSTTAPSGAGSLSAHRASAQARAHALDAPSAIVYVEFSTTTATTLSAGPTLNFTLPSIDAGKYYFLAISGPTGYQLAYEGPASVSGNTVSFTAASGTVAITATQPLVLALYESSSAFPPIVASTDAMTFDATNPSSAGVTVSEANYSGAFSSAIDCTENPAGQTPGSNAFVAQVTPATATPASAGGSVSFTVNGGAETGACNLTISDTNSQSATVAITVGTTSIGVFSAGRH